MYLGWQEGEVKVWFRSSITISNIIILTVYCVFILFTCLCQLIFMASLWGYTVTSIFFCYPHFSGVKCSSISFIGNDFKVFWILHSQVLVNSSQVFLFKNLFFWVEFLFLPFVCHLVAFFCPQVLGCPDGRLGIVIGAGTESPQLTHLLGLRVYSASTLRVC